jgi:hypothetical protein
MAFQLRSRGHPRRALAQLRKQRSGILSVVPPESTLDTIVHGMAGLPREAVTTS